MMKTMNEIVLDEKHIREFFINKTQEYFAGEIKKEKYAKIMEKLMYKQILPKGIAIEEVGLINLIEDAADLGHRDEGFDKKARGFIASK